MKNPAPTKQKRGKQHDFTLRGKGQARPDGPGTWKRGKDGELELARAGTKNIDPYSGKAPSIADAATSAAAEPAPATGQGDEKDGSAPRAGK